MSSNVKITDKDHGWNALFSAVKSIRGEGGFAKVGVLSEDPRGSAKPAGSDLTIAEIASVQEFGSQDGRIPERSFLRSTFDEKKAELADDGAELFARIVLDSSKMNLNKALNILGSKLASETKKKITTTEIPPPNAPSTVAQKGSSHPLIDTGAMVNAITWVVKIGEGEGDE